jgi:hypothetical protein
MQNIGRLSERLCAGLQTRLGWLNSTTDLQTCRHKVPLLAVCQRLQKEQCTLIRTDLDST